MRGTPFLIAVVVIASIGVIPQPVVADDEWTDSCDNADTVSPGTHSGRLSPADYDAFLVELSEGDFIQASLSFDTERVDGITFLSYNPTIRDGPYASSFSNTAENDWTELFGDNIQINDNRPDGEPAEFRLYNEGPDNVVCIVLYLDIHNQESSTPWEISFSLNEAEPPELVSSSEVSELQSRIDELESELEEKDQRISGLESQLEQKNETIIELESRVEELESQSSDGSSDGDVTIDITVNPGDGQEAFVEDGQAVVQAESESADVSDMRVEYGAGTYELDSSGEVAIPLAQTGTQEMTLVYGDTTEQVSIDVQAEADNQQDESGEEGSGDDGVSGVGPGFGIVATVIALLGAAFILRRRR